MRRILIVGSAVILGLGVLTASASGGGDRTVVRATSIDFKPRTATIDKGGKVVWKATNGDHTVTFKTLSFDKRINEGERVSRVFRRRGTFRYYCKFHRTAGMRGKVVVD